MRDSDQKEKRRQLAYLAWLPLVVALLFQFVLMPSITSTAADKSQGDSPSPSTNVTYQVTVSQNGQVLASSALEESTSTPGSSSTGASSSAETASSSKIPTGPAAETFLQAATDNGAAQVLSDKKPIAETTQERLARKAAEAKLSQRQENENHVKTLVAGYLDEQAKGLEGLKVGGHDISKDRMRQLVRSAADYTSDIEYIDQNAIMPSGCEIIALTITLHCLGYDEAEEIEIADEYVEYGSDEATQFTGSPYSSGGCFAPCIVDAANKWLKDNDSEGNAHAYDLTGSSFESICALVELGYPVLVWTTDGMVEPSVGSDWYQPEHCVVMYSLEGKADQEAKANEEKKAGDAEKSTSSESAEKPVSSASAASGKEESSQTSSSAASSSASSTGSANSASKSAASPVNDGSKSASSYSASASASSDRSSGSASSAGASKSAPAVMANSSSSAAKAAADAASKPAVSASSSDASKSSSVNSDNSGSKSASGFSASAPSSSAGADKSASESASSASTASPKSASSSSSASAASSDKSASKSASSASSSSASSASKPSANTVDSANSASKSSASASSSSASKTNETDSSKAASKSSQPKSDSSGAASSASAPSSSASSTKSTASASASSSSKSTSSASAGSSNASKSSGSSSASPRFVYTKVLVSDSLAGLVKRDYEDFKRIYEKAGMRAAFIQPE